MPVSSLDDFDFGDLADESGFVPAGKLLCGQGLVDVYRKLGGKMANPTPERITAEGLKDTDAVAARALELMAAWLPEGLQPPDW